MKKINNYLALMALLFVTNIVHAQSNILPTTGNVGIGTLSPTADLQVLGKSQLGSKKNATVISAQGNLSFKGTAVYQVDSNHYVFQNSLNPNYGLYFGQTIPRYEFRDQNALPTFFVGANNGNGFFSGQLGIGVENPISKLDVNGDINISVGSVLKMNGKIILKSEPYDNLFFGERDSIRNTTGVFNTALGYSALYFNTTGSANTASGYEALSFNTTGSFNTASGMYALYNNETGGYNTANGNSALGLNSSGNDNTAMGLSSLYYNSTGNENTAMGFRSMMFNKTGGSNTATGSEVLYTNTTGWYNTAYGYQALYSNTTGHYNTSLGRNADVNGNNYSNTTVIGNAALGTASNQVRIGNNAVTSIGGFTGWSNISDGRVKKNIKENVPGLNFINKLKPVTYNLDLNEADKIIQRPVIKDSLGNMVKTTQEELVARDAKMQVLYTGFIAQDVEKAAKSLNYNFSGVDAPKNEKDLYGLRYAEFVVPLVKAVQELSKDNDDKDAKIDDLQKQLNDLKNLVLSMQQQSSTNGFTQPITKTVGLSSASLEQNVPNPFSNVTTIGYNLPAQVSSAKIIVTDKTGKTIKEISLKGSGKGTIQLDASTLSGGTYQYALYVNNKLIVSKQMVLAK